MIKYKKKSPSGSGKKMSRGKKAALISISTIVGILLLAVIAGGWYVNSQLGKINYQPVKTTSQSPANVKTNDGTKLTWDSNVLNILLIGSDTREASQGGRSDSMILISINKNSKKIIMTSFMRDMYVPIAGHGQNKINAAYSYGGTSLLIQTIEQNFDIRIDKYMSVDFFSFIKIIDQLGGVNVSVTEKELPVLNSYVQEINRIEKLSENDGVLTKSGTNLLLTGKQALGYSRIRYVGNADFQRTERQRTVLNQVFSKIKRQNIFTQMSILNTLLPDVTTDLSKSDLMSLVSNSLTYKGYDVVQDRIPVDGSYQGTMVGSQDVLKIDFSKNIAELKHVIYGK